MEKQRNGGRKRGAPKSGTGVFLSLLALLGALAAIYAAGALGVQMAKSHLPEPDPGDLAMISDRTINLGRSGNPVFLADTPEALRRFFSDYPTAQARADADVTGSEIRKLQSQVDLSIVKFEADTAQVNIQSGSISGTTYWIHHSQIPNSEDFDPIISPIPGTRSE